MNSRPNNAFFDSEPGGRGAAPGPLALVQAFANTVAREGEHRWEAFEDPESLRSWLAQRGLLARGEKVNEADVAKAIDVRGALRSLLAANNGGEVAERAIRSLNGASERALLVISFGPGGDAALEPRAGGVDGAIGEILAAVKAGMEDGSWRRLKACERCGWAFYDRSKNRSGRWCSMEVCGNRAKTRAYRRRKSGADRKT
ncbi:MAG: hypothetical protein AVDCRST_MAG12-527 [uncultured Rubrobacteraceae bacterium]|uniref:Zinc finger CGNR domain-containing protein n=1 Tax=uncultured Rubrobacteraceae bacterium TaxID=349277 RepID=A0A6J4R9X9_9ACTN|nr:MAG: hypothetical protein AVDCRST_MAG12-527 [uncultured Rubrobacteraceae bacterium]